MTLTVQILAAASVGIVVFAIVAIIGAMALLEPDDD